ncbi:putative development/cell death domain-containing protein [Rosa chinensis]|uniref:Putative development/cell death domain-containing protein n=1 Tax=Rosa chinensis TaxID=74649 RepID=A0A2P6R8M7_ROSCH|nr:uncharacterized protein LOC112192629 [Rosa chinensis]PRQ42798.1 putative development/cell death domain-containing protein [Rosa chinensis]
MGAGRKTETYTLPSNQDLVPYAVSARNLMKNHLGAVIFGCTHSTMNECLSKQLFGLPAPHLIYVKKVTPGLPLFLFNYSDRKLYGIFEATGHGQMNIDPYGWTADGSGRTQFPAQVRMRVRQQCRPLLESQFKPIIADNYFNPQHFMFELDHVQTRNLLSLLAPLTISPGKPTPQNPMLRETDSQALPSSSTIQKAESCKPLTSEAENPTPLPNWETDFPALPTQNTIQKTELLKPPTSGAENLNSVPTVNWETEFPALPSRNTLQKKAVLCKPATSVPQNRVELETDIPTLPSSSTVVEPEWPYQLTSQAEHLNSSHLKGGSTCSTPQNTLKWEADFPDFPSINIIQEPEWLEALISEAEYLNSSNLKLDSVPLAGDAVDSKAESPFSQFDQKSGESSCYFSAQSPGSMFYPGIITKLLLEVQELKASSTAQTEKMRYLEDKLVEALFEIQQLKDLLIDGV